jgi:hypothetical protein
MASSFDMTKLRAATARAGGIINKSKKELLLTAAKGFVRDILKFTPPASQGVTGSAAKKAGEGAVAADVARIFLPSPDTSIEDFRAMFNGAENSSEFRHKGAAPLGVVRARILTAGEMAAWHAKRRRKSDGRVLNVNRNVTTGLRKRDLLGLDIGIVRTSDYNNFVRVLKSNVGILAAGWVAPANHLKVPGNVVEVTTATRFHLELSNEVPFVGNVKDYARRVQKVLDYQASKLDRQIDYLVAKAIKRAGF